MNSKLLNLIAYVHILVPHLEIRLNQICSGYSWPSYFSAFQKEMDDQMSIPYLLEKSNRYLGIDLIGIDYDRIYEIDNIDTSMFSEKAVSSNPIKVKELSLVTDYFIEIGVYSKIHDASLVEPEKFYKYPDGREAELLETAFSVHGADPWVTTFIKDYYHKYVCSRKWNNEDNNPNRSTWVKDDRLPVIERDLKIRSILK